MMKYCKNIGVLIGLLILLAASRDAPAQNIEREFAAGKSARVEIENLSGRVEVTADDALEGKIAVAVRGAAGASALDRFVKFDDSGGSLKIAVAPAAAGQRIDLIVKTPPRARVRVETGAGEVRLAGDFESAEVETVTGTIAANVPLDNLAYDFLWTESRPRFLSDVELEKIREKAAGKFAVKGKLAIGAADDVEEVAANEESGENEEGAGKKSEAKKRKNVSLKLTTARGIVLLNVNPNEVPSDLRERPLTEAAKAIIKSGDSLLTEAIRRASPKYFGDYAKTLPPHKSSPVLSEAGGGAKSPAPVSAAAAAAGGIKKVLVRVTDINNRAISGLEAKDFEITEAGEKREILAIEPATAPFNLVLLLDVSGSVDNYVNFIRKAARQFVETSGKTDRIAIIIFNDDVKQLSTFTADHRKLSESLDTFDAGGGTAFYDALAYTLAETLRTLRGERTAIVALTDGDDNRSFLPFDALLGSIQESGALIYPLYVPSSLIAAASSADPFKEIDPLRSKYTGLTTKAEGEGEKLAQISGGVYYPISRLSEIEQAYADIVTQLRTAYTVTFRSATSENRGGDNRASPRLKVKINRENAFVKLGSVVEAAAAASKEISETNEINKEAPAAKSEAVPDERFTIEKPENDAAETNLFIDAVWKKDAAENSVKKPVQITAEIESVRYKPLVNDDLRTIKSENFDINAAPGAFLLAAGASKTIAVSRWISPKRTRSYPYERVYDTLAYRDGVKASVIPVVKDEGLGGDRDFLQWDTISLLSLLDVYFIPAFYTRAEKNAKRSDRIAAQKLDGADAAAQLIELSKFSGTARQWNEQQARRLKSVFEKARAAYREISKQTKTYLHDETALNELIELLAGAAPAADFAEYSRRKALRGQSRELSSIQPKEALATDSKGAVTITNLAGGKYFFTCDETRVEDKTLFLIEAKHSRRAILPSENDIKDGLVKMMIYTNLQNVRVEGAGKVSAKAVLRLTSSSMSGALGSNAAEAEIAAFLAANQFDVSRQNLIRKLFAEARANDFMIILEKGATGK